jgi:nucleotide-binding universal stress UspA family protein
MDRILMATDFSPRSDRALRRASLIAREAGASIMLVHVVDADWPARLADSDRAAAAAILTDAASTLRDHDGIDADWLVTNADVHEGILAAADETSADLIVIGPNRSRLSDIFTGTTAERLVRRSTRPLLVAVEMAAAPYRKTILTVDFDEASRSASRKAMAMGIFDHTEVLVMHAFDTPATGMMRRSMQSSAEIDDYVESERDSAAAELRRFASEMDLPRTCQVVVSMNGTSARTILDSAREAGSDLIVLGTNQRKGFERALIGSVTADVIRDAHRDVLIIPVDEPA